MTKVHLPDVTICAADSAFVDSTALALTRSMEHCEFGDAILFSHAPKEGPFRNIQIEPLKSLDAYSRFCLRIMPDFIETSFALVVQWDGFVVNPNAWARAFEKFDYIGAAWHGLFAGSQAVGNGGFSLRSRKLLKAVQRLPPSLNAPEDRFICHAHRTTLERNFGIRFATTKIADRFSYQFSVPESLPFGFHGPEHLWRHLSDDDLSKIAKKIDISKTNSGQLIRLILNCADHDHPNSALTLYQRVRESFPIAIVKRVLAENFDPSASEEAMVKLNRLVST
jgi:hypothetical protein